MSRLARGAQPNPASFIISGSVDSGSTWYEDIDLTQNGEPLTDVDDHVWTMEFYGDPGDASILTLTTADGTLTVTESTATTLSIRVGPTALSDMCGDYWCDLKSTDASPTVDGEPRVYLWGRGIVTFVEGAA
jgi:hypothetical protein